MVYEHFDDMSAEAPPRPQQYRERRATLCALKTWTSARKEDEIPDLASLTGKPEPGQEQEAFTENQFLILFEPRSSNSVMIFYGNELPTMPGRRNVGNSLQQTLSPSLRNTFRDACVEAVEKGDVVHRRGMIDTPSGATVLYRSIFMPLRSGGQSDRIYVFGAFSNQEGGAELLAAA